MDMDIKADAQVFVWRSGANDWAEIDPALWIAHRDRGESLTGFCGDVHVASCVLMEGRVANIRTTHRRLDADGRLLEHLDALSPEEARERDALMLAPGIGDAGTRRYHALCEKEWRAGLPPVAHMRRLLRHIHAPLGLDTAAIRMLFKEIGLDPAAWVTNAHDAGAN